jgi:Protein of unknown function (DUF2852)
VCRRKHRSHERDHGVLRKGGVIRHLALDRADKTSGRPRLRCTAWHSRRAACAGAAKRRGADTSDTRSEPVSLAKPFSRSGTRTFRALGGQRLSCLANVDNQKSVLISRGRHPIPLCFVQAVNMDGERSNHMSPDTGMSYQSSSWKPVEILAMVVGFIVFWPIGLGVLGWKFWQKKSGYPGDIISFGREKWGTGRTGHAAPTAGAFR